jgi:hypothetical protein
MSFPVYGVYNDARDSFLGGVNDEIDLETGCFGE